MSFAQLDWADYSGTTHVGPRDCPTVSKPSSPNSRLLIALWKFQIKNCFAECLTIHKSALNAAILSREDRNLNRELPTEISDIIFTPDGGIASIFRGRLRNSRKVIKHFSVELKVIDRDVAPTIF